IGPSAPPSQPQSVTIAANFQSQFVGCSDNWQADCASTHLTYDPVDTVWQAVFGLHSADWAYKAALNDSWTESYGMPDGSNVDLNLATDFNVKFYYDNSRHWVTDSRKVIAVAPG